VLTCDRQTDGRTDRHMMTANTRASIALRGKITDFNLPHLYFAPLLRVAPLEFYQDLLIRKKHFLDRIQYQPMYSFVSVILCLATLA